MMALIQQAAQQVTTQPAPQQVLSTLQSWMQTIGSWAVTATVAVFVVNHLKGLRADVKEMGKELQTFQLEVHKDFQTTKSCSANRTSGAHVAAKPAKDTSSTTIKKVVEQVVRETVLPALQLMLTPPLKASEALKRSKASDTDRVKA